MKRQNIAFTWPNQLKKMIKNGIIITFLIQLLIVVDQIVRQSVWCREHIRDAVNYHDVICKAKRLQELLSNICVPTLMFLLIGVSLIPIYLFYRYYMGSKSIYLILRLPQKREKFFISHVKNAIEICMLIWLVQFLLLLVYYALYQGLIPEQNRLVDEWKNLWNCDQFRYFYPILHIVEIIRPLICMVLLPSLCLLGIIALQSGRALFLGVLVTVIGIASLYGSIHMSVLSLVGEMLACCLVVGTGFFYLKHVALT